MGWKIESNTEAWKTHARTIDTADSMLTLIYIATIICIAEAIFSHQWLMLVPGIYFALYSILTTISLHKHRKEEAHHYEETTND